MLRVYMKEWDILALNVATAARSLKRHVESKHEEVRFPCSQCVYIATQASDLERHVESKHEGVRYPCPKCEFIATRASYLKKHVGKNHEGERYSWVYFYQAIWGDRSEIKMFVHSLFSRSSEPCHL